jgi:hypothetical protein
MDYQKMNFVPASTLDQQFIHGKYGFSVASAVYALVFLCLRAWHAMCVSGIERDGRSVSAMVD